MHTLDRLTAYLDQSIRLTLESVQSFREQCDRAFRDARQVRIPASYRKTNSILLCGMGGSALGADVVRSVFMPVLKVPFGILNGYQLPRYVGPKTLVVLSSYSGTTEEVLANAREAVKRKAIIMGLTMGSTLADFFRKHRLPWYQIDGMANPSGQPRMGLGYNIMGLIGLLRSAGFLIISSSDIQGVLRTVQNRMNQCKPEVPASRNKAKQLAHELEHRLILLTGADHLTGCLHAFANQLNETAKAYAVAFPFPELNHHLMEGLKFPRAVRNATFVTTQSSLYKQRMVQRIQISRRIVRSFGLATPEISIQGKTKLEQAFDLLTVAGFVSLYLALLHRVNPLEIPTVNELKQRLARSVS
jgi:glucose/mannose-6-phosphate isomerase